MTTRKLSHKARIAIVLSLLVLAPVIVQTSGLSSQLSVAHLRELVGQAGTWGALAFLAVFVAAVVAQVPGIPFVALAPTLFRLPEAWATKGASTRSASAIAVRTLCEGLRVVMGQAGRLS